MKSPAAASARNSSQNKFLSLRRSDASSEEARFSVEDDESRRMLIICVDRDDDIGVKTGLKTPILGKDACVRAATRLAIADPEEADANTIFAAVKEYDALMAKGFECEVIVVSGLFEGGVLGDRKVRGEISEVLNGFPAGGAVIVSDGAEGEELVPVIQTLVPIISVKKIVIKHSKSVEESYQVLGRYLRMLLFDPRYARYALGVPGLIFIGVVLISLVNSQAALFVLVVIIGIIFVVRGFDIDRRIESIGSLSATGYLRLFAAMASLLIILGGIASGVSVFFVKKSCLYLSSSIPSCNIPSTIQLDPGQNILTYAPQIIGYFIIGSQEYVWLGIGVYITTSIFFNILRSKPRHITRNVVALAVLGMLYFPVSIFASDLLNPTTASPGFLTAMVMLALAVNFSIAAYLYRYFSKRRRTSQPLEV